MKILVIEDKEMHRKSAKLTLAGHEVTIVDSYDKAMELLQPQMEFEVVLTDMMLPMSESGLAYGIFKPSEEVPYGYVIALRAALHGAKFVAMVTDINHHQGAMSSAIDELGNSTYEETFTPNFVINGAKVMFVHTPFVQKLTKDVPCDRCRENPGVCSRCNGTGWENEPGARPQDCRQCVGTDAIGKCSQCKGAGKWDRMDKTDAKDWGKVLADLIA